MARDARQMKMSAGTTPATGAPARMRCPSSSATARLGGVGPPVTGRSTSAMPTLASTVGSVWIRLGHTGVSVLRALLGLTVRLTLTTVPTSPAGMEGPVLTRSTTFCVSVNLHLMERHVKEKWTPVAPTPVKMEPHVPPMETTRSTPAPAPLATRAPSARWT